MTMNSPFSLRLILVSTVAVIMGATAAPARAEDGDAPAVTVNFGDLNLAHPAGITQLYGRIRAAANKVCQPYSIKAPFAAQAMDACVGKAMSKAITDVHEPALTAMYVEKSGKAATTRVARLN
jgi:UrcA family protein